MKNLILLLGLFLGSFVLTSAQAPGRNPGQTPLPEDVGPAERRKNQDDISKRSNDLRMTEDFPVKSDQGKIVQQYIRPLYREPSKEEWNLLAPSSEDTEKFSEFLRQKNTGLIKLIADKGCDKNTVVAASAHCSTYTMPGAGSAFSFRTNNYGMKHLADLNFTGKSFQALGSLIHGIMVNLGDAPLENVDLKTEGVSYLTKLRPVSDIGKAQEFADQLTKGINDNGFVYRSILPVKENTTYVLRSIAYEGVLPRTIRDITYNEFEFDKRRDVIIAFRVVRHNLDENATILWKELSDKKAPKLSMEK